MFHCVYVVLKEEVYRFGRCYQMMRYFDILSIVSYNRAQDGIFKRQCLYRYDMEAISNQQFFLARKHDFHYHIINNDNC